MNTKHTITMLQLASALALALSGAGCLGQPDATTATTGDVAATDGVNGTLLHTIDLGNDHKVDFYDFGDGKVGTREEFAIGDRPLIDDQATESQTLAQLYRRVRAEGTIPTEIVDADTRAAVAIARLEELRAANPGWKPAPTTEPAQTQVQAQLSGDIAEVKSALPANCSGDLLGDNWGAQWWINNFCQGFSSGKTCSNPLFLTVDHRENAASYTNQAGGGYFWQYKQLEGDFTVAGKSRGYTTGFPYPNAHEIWNQAVQPRKGVIFTINGSGFSWQTNHVEGSSPCNHLMVAAVWC